MYQYFPLIPLIIATLQDIKKKAVSDILNYFMVVFTWILAIFLYLKYNFYPENIFFGFLVLLFFLILFLIRAVAIGDLFIILWLIYYISFLDIYRIFLFLIFTLLSGFLVANLNSLVILYKSKDEDFYLAVVSNLLMLPGFILFVLFYKYLYEQNLLIISVSLILISFIIFKLYDENIKNKLTFIRTPQELVEGDWVEGEIFVRRIPFDILDDIKRKFIVEEKDIGYILKLKRGILSGDKGLSKKQIELLRKVGEYNDVKVKVREGYPFVPAIFLGYILSLI